MVFEEDVDGSVDAVVGVAGVRGQKPGKGEEVLHGEVLGRGDAREIGVESLGDLGNGGGAATVSLVIRGAKQCALASLPVQELGDDAPHGIDLGDDNGISAAAGRWRRHGEQVLVRRLLQLQRDAPLHLQKVPLARTKEPRGTQQPAQKRHRHSILLHWQQIYDGFDNNPLLLLYRLQTRGVSTDILFGVVGIIVVLEKAAEGGLRVEHEGGSEDGVWEAAALEGEENEAIGVDRQRGEVVRPPVTGRTRLRVVAELRDGNGRDSVRTEGRKPGVGGRERERLAGGEGGDSAGDGAEHDGVDEALQPRAQVVGRVLLRHLQEVRRGPQRRGRLRGHLKVDAIAELGYVLERSLSARKLRDLDTPNIILVSLHNQSAQVPAFGYQGKLMQSELRVPDGNGDVRRDFLRVDPLAGSFQG
eukprot:TRINITY_DN1227_c0_g1_i4.p2 TRINITY_DN1227_c0_g1~~TRINITY_DN1227_c0_g1_i4.p2  ORF type:complete len:417 (-),score=-11.49 TRINITY_DN1227_c0_g1_i4:305-1555(-)